MGRLVSIPIQNQMVEAVEVLTLRLDFRGCHGLDGKKWIHTKSKESRMGLMILKKLNDSKIIPALILGRVLFHLKKQGHNLQNLP